MVDRDHHDYAPLATVVSGQPKDNFLLLEDHDATGGSAQVGRQLHASVKRTWSSGKKSSESAALVRRLHSNIIMPVANGAPDTNFSKPKKPRRQLDQDYSQPGKFRGVRYRGKGHYSAELKVSEVRRWLGIISSATKATCAFDRAAFEDREKDARLNFPKLIEVAVVHQQKKDGLPVGKNPQEEDGDVLYLSVSDVRLPSSTWEPRSVIPCEDASQLEGEESNGLG